MKRVFIAAAISVAVASPLFAQSFPAKPLRVIVPLAAGTGTDQMSRVLAQKLGEQLAQPVVVENRPGAGATLGTEVAARAAPDGHTLYMGGSVALTISPALFGKVSYDPLKDFSAISLISRFFLVLAAHPSLPVRNAKELVTLARSRPGELVIASSGNGTVSHLTAAMFENMGRMKLLHVQYKGGDTLVAILRGEAQLSFVPVSLGQQQAGIGKLRMLGVTSRERLPSMAAVPAIAETIPGFEWSGWQVLMAPAGTPSEIQKRLQDAVQKAMGTPEFKAYLDREGSEAFTIAPARFPEFLRTELEKNARLVKISGARVE